MRLATHVCLAAVLVYGAMACGGRAPQQQAQQQAQKDTETGPGLQQMAKGFEAMAKSMKEIEAMSKEAPVDPVDYKALEAFLPDLPGWEKGEIEGEKVSAPLAISKTNVSYTKDDASIRVEITDSAHSQMFMAPFIVFLSTDYARESSSGYEKSIRIGNHQGWETYHRDGKEASVNLLVAKRYLVSLTGNGIEDTKVLRDAIGRIDLSRLAALK